MTSILPISLLLVLAACEPIPGADSRLDLAVRGQDPGTPIAGLMEAGRPLADVTSIQVDVLTIMANVDDEWVTLSADPQTIDLIGLEDGTVTALNDALVPSGHYEQVRLILGDDNFIVADGEMFALRIPSGSQSGLKIPIDATLDEGTDYTLVLKFDLDHNLVHNANGWMLTPVLHVESLDGGDDDDDEDAENVGDENEEEDEIEE